MGAAVAAAKSPSSSSGGGGVTSSTNRCRVHPPAFTTLVGTPGSGNDRAHLGRALAGELERGDVVLDPSVVGRQGGGLEQVDGAVRRHEPTAGERVHRRSDREDGGQARSPPSLVRSVRDASEPLSLVGSPTPRVGEPVPCGLTAARQRPYRSCPNDLGTHRVPRREERVATGHAVVEGIEVSTDHWIGGARVSSAETFVDVSPIDEMPIAEVARGGAAEADQAVAAAREGFAVWGSMPPKDRAEVLHRIADGVEARVPELAAVETRDNGSLLRSMRNSVMPRVARNFRFFADHLLTLGGRQGPRRVRRAFRVGPQRRHRGDHAVERPVDARHLARGSGAGGRQRRDPQAAGVGAAHRVDARRHRARCRPARRRVQRAAGDRRGGGRRPHRPPRPGPHRVHRIGTDRQARGAGRRREPHPGEPGARGQVAVRRLRRRRSRRGRRTGGQPVRQRRPGLPGRDRGCSWRRRSTTSSWTGSPGPPPRSCKAIHEKRPPTSARRSHANTSSASTGSSNAPRPTVPVRSSAADPTTSSGACTTDPRCSPTRRRDPRSSRRRSSARSSPCRRSTTRTRRSPWRTTREYGLAAILYTGDPGRAERVSAEARGRHRLGQLLLRARPGGPVRRLAQLRDRPRGRHLELRFLRDVKNVCTAPWTT